MNAFVTKHKLLSEHQYGFIPGAGTQMLLKELSDTLHGSIDRNEVLFKPRLNF